MAGLPLSPQVFAILGALVEERAGLHYGPDDRELFGEKVSIRALEAGFDSLLDYYYFLRYDPGGAEELDQLVESLVVGETFFFRELAQLELLVDDVLVPAVQAGRRPRVWSAACSTGEEPLTLAMLLADRGVLGGVELVASDVSARSLSRAREGRHGVRALRPPVPEALASRWLVQEPLEVRSAAALRAAVDFRRVNLLDEGAVAALGTFDAVLCRNVLIYFADPTARRVLASLAAALAPGGVLLVGVSESLLRYGTGLSCEEHRGVFLYRKERG